MLNTKVMGHRGAALLAPENTLASIRAAAATGVTWAEIDVYPLADNGLVIFHDDTLERCTDGTGVTEAASLDYVLSLHAGKGFANQFADEKVPSLSEALTCFQELGLGLNLEIKYGGAEVDRVVPLIVDALHQHGFDNNQLMISSFNYEALVKCRALDANLHLAWLCEDIPADWAEKLAAIQAYSLNCDYQLLTESQARAVKAAGYKLLCYTANDPAAVAEHWGWGMDTIITDDPRLFL